MCACKGGRRGRRGGRERERVSNTVEDGVQELYTLFLEKGLSMAWALPSRLGWLASGFHQPTRLGLPELGLQACVTMPGFASVGSGT